MEPISQIIATVLSSTLLAPSTSRLAVTLGYKSRATLYRLMRCEASATTVEAFCQKAAEVLGVDTDTLYSMDAALCNASHLSRLMKSGWMGTTDDQAFEVVRAFVFHDYTNFSEEFRSVSLPELSRLELSNPDAFFAMLGLYYYKSLLTDFYAPASKTHAERCAAIIEPLGERLTDIDPANGVAVESALVYSMTSLLSSEVPILWNCITSIALMLRLFAMPDPTAIVDSNVYLMPFLSDRSYWRDPLTGEVWLLRALKFDLPGSGCYEFFSVDVSEAKAVCRGILSFLGDEVCRFRDKASGCSRLGVFGIDDESISFSWDGDRPEAPTGPLARLYPERSESLRRADRCLTDPVLQEASLLSEGFEIPPGCRVEDVIMSRSGVRLSLAGGRVYETAYSASPFLRKVHPADEVIIACRLSDGRVFVSWPRLMHSLPLDFFHPLDN